MSTQEQEQPSQAKELERAAEVKKPSKESDPSTTPREGSSRKVDPEELNPDDFE